MTRPRIEIDPDIRRAETLPSWVYHEREAFELARERVFAHSWQFVGHEEMVRVPRQVHPFTLLEGMLDEPLLLARDDADQLRCLSNVCTHRGNLVVDRPGRLPCLRCPYHGRRFGLDGRFESMPEFEETADFPGERDHLPEVPLERWGPLLFVSLDPGFAFDAYLAPVRDRLPWFDPHELVFAPDRSRDYLVKANWALYCENYLEGFHIPFVHASLNETLDYGSYRTELFDSGNLQLGVSPGGEETFDLPADAPDAGTEVAAYYYWLFPNLMLNVYPWGLSVNVVKPLAPDRTRVSFLTWVGDESRLDQGAGSDLDRVEREDEAIVEAVQRGVQSRLYDRGRYSPTREQGVHQFHRMLAHCLNGDGAEARRH